MSRRRKDYEAEKKKEAVGQKSWQSCFSQETRGVEVVVVEVTHHWVNMAKLSEGITVGICICICLCVCICIFIF